MWRWCEVCGKHIRYHIAVRIAYINHGRFPTEKAYGSQIAQVCQAMADLGNAVTLVSPTFRNPIAVSGSEYYGISGTVEERHLPHFDAFRSWYVPGKLAFVVSMFSYARSVLAHVVSRNYELLYVRSPLLLARAVGSGIPTVIELHDIPRIFRKSFVRCCNRCRVVVALTSPMRQELIAIGVRPEKIRVESDGVDLRRFADHSPPLEAKSQWPKRFPQDRPVMGYVGTLTTRETLSKGVEDMVNAAAELKEKNVKIFTWIVGGPERAVEELRQRAMHLGLTDAEIGFEGRIDASRVSSALWACDLCVYPAPASRHSYFMRDTSPLKLFEYMASRRPIVCADIPPVRDVVDERSVLFYQPGNAAMLAEQIGRVLGDPQEAQKRVRFAAETVQKHDWRMRMERILTAAGSL